MGWAERGLGGHRAQRRLRALLRPCAWAGPAGRSRRPLHAGPSSSPLRTSSSTTATSPSSVSAASS
eukprot:10484983-Lingulodinium_polyedra.AAC.1